jgi:hypothetical protein
MFVVGMHRQLETSRGAVLNFRSNPAARNELQLRGSGFFRPNSE